MKEACGNYPLSMDTPDNTATAHIFGEAKKLIEHPVFNGLDRNEVFELFASYIEEAKSHFILEEEARRENVLGANLYYHGKEHAVYQITHDAIFTLLSALSRHDRLSSHITAHGAFGVLTSPALHDIGYVKGVQLGENFAARTPIHVEESMKAYAETVEKLGVPEGLNKERVIKMGILAIHRTHFPYTAEHEREAREMLSELSPEERREAQIVRLLVQFADLGGQCARSDYFPEGVTRLREEMNAAKSGNGTAIIGEDHELSQKASGFMTYVVDKTVGKTGQAILREGITPFSNKWNAIGKT